MRYATQAEAESLRTWLPSSFSTVGVRVIDGWQALRGGSFPVPEPRAEPMFRDQPLSGFRIGEDLARVVVTQSETGWWSESGFGIIYNAVLCARGLDRWEGDGGR